MRKQTSPAFFFFFFFPFYRFLVRAHDCLAAAASPVKISIPLKFALFSNIC